MRVAKLPGTRRIGHSSRPCLANFKEDTTKYRLINYFDVWGNKKDGYEINNLCEDAIVCFPDVPDKREILSKLKRIGFLRKSCRMASIVETNQGDGDFIDFEDAYGRPIFRLERNDGTEEEDCYHKEYQGINIRKVYDEAQV